MRESLKNVCERYRVNFSSAKNVIQIYRKEGRLEKKLQKTRKQGTGNLPKGLAGAKNGNLSEDSIEYGEELEEDGLQFDDDVDNSKPVTLAPEDQRCKLNLYVQPIEADEEGKSQKEYFQMNLEHLLQASPELNLDLKTQF